MLGSKMLNSLPRGTGLLELSRRYMSNRSLNSQFDEVELGNMCLTGAYKHESQLVSYSKLQLILRSIGEEPVTGPARCL
ncbi:hypothetical protein GJAV_G00142750 [Gymnothorax javanicus]|nr:hypothetical protein GJAV_G00142750 [Gymnothorax javanicus]